MRDALLALCNGLYRGSVRSGGSEEEALAAAHEAIDHFRKFLALLPEDGEERKTLFKLKVNDQTSFETVWALLDRKSKEGVFSEGHCVENRSGDIERLLAHPDNQDFLNVKNSSVKSTLVENNFNHCLAVFDECVSGKPFTISTHHCDNSPAVCAMTLNALVEEYAKNPHLFEKQNILAAATGFMRQEEIIYKIIETGNVLAFEIVLKIACEEPQELCSLFVKYFNFEHPPISPIEFMKLFVKYGFDIRNFKRMGTMPLIDWAIYNRYFDVAEWLLTNNPEENNSLAIYVLEQASEQCLDDLLKVRPLLGNQANRTSTNTPLTIAISRGYLGHVRVLLNHGCDVEKQVFFDGKLQNAIELALSKKITDESDIKIVHLLLGKVANLARYKKLLIDWAIKNNDPKIFEMLEEAGISYSGEVDFSTLSSSELVETGIKSAIKAGNLDEVKKLVEKNPHLINGQAWNFPLVEAATYGKIEIVPYFLSQKCDLDNTALIEAIENQHWEIVLELLKVGAKVRFSFGDAPGQYAVLHRPLNVLAWLEPLETAEEIMNLLLTHALEGNNRKLLVIMSQLRWWLTLLEKLIMQSQWDTLGKIIETGFTSELKELCEKSSELEEMLKKGLNVDEDETSEDEPEEMSEGESKEAANKNADEKRLAVSTSYAPSSSRFYKTNSEKSHETYDASVKPIGEDANRTFSPQE